MVVEVYGSKQHRHDIHEQMVTNVFHEYHSSVDHRMLKRYHLCSIIFGFKSVQYKCLIKTRDMWHGVNSM